MSVAISYHVNKSNVATNLVRIQFGKKTDIASKEVGVLSNRGGAALATGYGRGDGQYGDELDGRADGQHGGELQVVLLVGLKERRRWRPTGALVMPPSQQYVDSSDGITFLALVLLDSTSFSHVLVLLLHPCQRIIYVFIYGWQKDFWCKAIFYGDNDAWYQSGGAFTEIVAKDHANGGRDESTIVKVHDKTKAQPGFEIHFLGWRI
ncbi:hypothetical protein NE237_010486 [Protea cynaroides]|uniref:Uncharacterized protein n=1 Tax=Protea cynaroides TaxID=273540 RepID=A0A9Q0KZV5_9MAGN|nr:hypothetical protein NE237_010486 [Protea cynaroides]